MLELDADFGGDDVTRVFSTDGSTQDVKAGQGVTPAIGLHYQPARAPFDFAVMVGYKFVTTRASNVDIHINRVEVKAEKDATLQFTAEPGKNYYVRQEVKMGLWAARTGLELEDALSAYPGLAVR